MRFATHHVFVGFLLLNAATSSVHAQDVQVDEKVNNGALELSKADEFVELLTTSYAADLALQTVYRTAECTRTEPRCAPLLLAQDVILGPWHFVKLMRVIQELPDVQFATIVEPRKYTAPSLQPAPELPAEVVSLAQYAMEQHVVFYAYLEAWQITMERYGTAVGSSDEPAATAQRRAIERYGLQASTAAAGVSAALKFLEVYTSAFSLCVGHCARRRRSDKNTPSDSWLRARAEGTIFCLWDSTSGQRQPSRRAHGPQRRCATGSSGGNGGGREGVRQTGGPDDGVSRFISKPAAEGQCRLGSGTPCGRCRLRNSGAGRNQIDRSGGGVSTTSGPGVHQSCWLETDDNPTVGTHHIALTVDDGKGGTDVDVVTITVADAGAPQSPR